jgi:hypothetical protein
MPPLALFVPTGSDLAGWGGALFACLVLIGLGRALTAGRATPEAALIAGWGGAVLVLTAWGVATEATLRLPAIALAAVGVAALASPRWRLPGAQWRAIARLLALALPLLAVMASARPSLPDTWLNLLPNAAYLYDHGFFPADARPAAHSFIAGAPYNMQLLSFIANLVTPGFSLTAMIDLNILLQLAAGLLLARLASGHEEGAPSWTMTALGILLAMALNPGFDPRYHLSDYSEPSVTVTAAFAGWFAARALDRVNGGRDARPDFWLLALSLAALVNIKQESIMLVVGVLAAALWLVGLARGGRRSAFLALGLAALPAALVYLLWRWYVLSHFALGELKNLPLSAWHVNEIPQILAAMAGEAAQRVVFFIPLILLIIIALWRVARRQLDLATRLAAMSAGVALVYNAGLVFAYVAHFEGQMATDAHSYFRYNTHLALLLMAAYLLLLRSWNWQRLATRRPRAVPALLIGLVLLDPFPFLRLLRFDLEAPNLRVWQLAREAAPRLVDGERLALVLPHDNGSVRPALEALLRDAPPRRAGIDLAVAPDLGAAHALQGYDHALLSCLPAAEGGAPQGSAALLVRDGAGWKTEAVWPYALVPAHARWSQVLAPAALCLGR